MNTAKQLVRQVIDTIGIKEEKEATMADFVDRIEGESLLALMASLESPKKEEFQKEFEAINGANHSQMDRLVQKFFPIGDVHKMQRQKASELLTLYIDALGAAISEDKRTQALALTRREN